MAVYTLDNRPAAINWEAKGETARTLQNCKNLLMLRMGEVPYDRLRGLDPAIFDAPVSDLRGRLRREAELALGWEPDARVIAARARVEGLNAPLIIEIDVEVALDG